MSKKTQILNSLRDYDISSEIFRNEDVSSIQSRIEKLFRQYEIGYYAINYNISPTIIRFEIIPESGFHISKIKKQKDELVMSLGPRGVRIIAPVPGKGTVAIEFPRSKPQIVGLKQILESAEFNDDSLCLPIACGIDSNNKPVVADLVKMPHLFIAGATGQGKTNFLNTLITSLLNVKLPDEIKFLLIDPKMVEFGAYEQIKDQYLVNIKGIDKGVIYDINDSALALDALVAEMERRYCLLQSAGYRNISDYNSKTEAERLPYIVGIIDEYADLKMTLDKEIESPLIRLAAMSRAVGIHLIVATQRPSTNIITGVVKANFPCRIAFKTIQKVDSKVIIDCEGAERLIGRGDMLLFNGSLNRVQAPFIDYDEISDICTAISSDNSTEAKSLTINSPKQDLANINEMVLDDLFDSAARLIINAGEGRTSSLLRSFCIGYNRAGKIIDQLEAAGIIGPSIAGKPREVLMTMDDYETICFNTKTSTQKDNAQLDSLFTAVAIYILGKREALVADIEKSFDISSIRATKIVDQLETEGVISKATPTKPCACLISVSDLLKKYSLQ